MDLRSTNFGSRLVVTDLLLCCSMMFLAGAGAVEGAGAPAVPTVKVAQVTVNTGQAATLTAVVSGVAAGSNYTLSWYAGPGTPLCSGTYLQSSSSDIFHTVPLTASTTYCVMLNAGSQGTAVANATVTVKLPTPSSGTLTNADYYWGILVGATTISLAIAALVVYWFYYREEEEGEEEAPSKAGAESAAPAVPAPAPDPCADYKKAYDDATDEYNRLDDEYEKILSRPRLDRSERAGQAYKAREDASRRRTEAGARYVKCLDEHSPSAGGPRVGSDATPSPLLEPAPPPLLEPAPPAATIPPVAVPTIAEKSKPPTAPPVVPIPLPRETPPPALPRPAKEKPRPQSNPCPPGSEPKTEVAYSCEVELYLLSKAKVEIDGVYSAGEEDMNRAIEGIESTVVVAGIGTGSVGAAGDPVGNILGQLRVPSVTDAPGRAKQAPFDPLQGLEEKLRKLPKYGDITVMYPQARFRLSCLIKSECRNGYWTVTERSLKMEKLGQPKPVTMSAGFVGRASDLPRALQKIGRWTKVHNAAAERKMRECEKACRP